MTQTPRQNAAARGFTRPSPLRPLRRGRRMQAPAARRLPAPEANRAASGPRSPLKLGKHVSFRMNRGKERLHQRIIRAGTGDGSGWPVGVDWWKTRHYRFATDNPTLWARRELRPRDRPGRGFIVGAPVMRSRPSPAGRRGVSRVARGVARRRDARGLAAARNRVGIHGFPVESAYRDPATGRHVGPDLPRSARAGERGVRADEGAAAGRGADLPRGEAGRHLHRARRAGSDGRRRPT